MIIESGKRIAIAFAFSRDNCSTCPLGFNRGLSFSSTLLGTILHFNPTCSRSCLRRGDDDARMICFITDTTSEDADQHYSA